MRLEDRTCVITGGSSGIGAATVRRFVKEGARVLLADIDLDGAKALAAELGDAVTAVRCDIRLVDDVERVARTALERWGRVDVLVNNAACELNSAYAEISVKEWDRVQDTNFRGPWLMCKYLVPHMVERGSGSVVNVASATGITGTPMSTGYGGAKGGVVMFTRHMAIELASSGVRINCVCPGVIDTPMLERWINTMRDRREAEKLVDGMMPIRRRGRAEEVAGAILFFASDDSTLCQGSVLAVDGGFSA